MPLYDDRSATPLTDDEAKDDLLSSSTVSQSASWRSRPLHVLRSSSNRERNSSLSSADLLQQTTPDSAEEPKGLEILRHGVEPVNFDIVAVHGIEGHPLDTWTHPNKHLWLRDSLPHHLPNTRVMTFGYDATIFTKSVADVRTTARALLSDLNTQRKACQGRPMMFVCHSLGGIIFKEALNVAHTKLPDDIYKDVTDSTKAVAFLGTPHAGAPAASWAQKASSLVNFLSARLYPLSDKFVNCLTIHSSDLNRISSDFVNRAEPLIIKSFVEGIATSKAGLSHLVVDESSALMHVHNEEHVPVLSADHISICKFSSGSSEKFRIVAQKIIDVVHGLVKGSAKDPLESPPDAGLQAQVLRCLYKKPETAKQKTKNPVPETCTWILHYTKYEQWRESETSSILWISAPPGYGKTVLARFLEDRHVRRKKHREITGEKHREITVCSFFCGRDMETQKSAVTILRMILWQLLEAKRELIHHAVAWHESQGDNMADDLDTLWALCKTCFEDSRLGETVIVVDALDEFDKEHRDHLMGWVQEVFKYRSNYNLSPLRVIMTGRPDTFSSHQLRSSIVLKLDDGLEATEAVSRDVNRFIDARIVELANARDDFEDDAKLWLTRHLKDNAGKTFLWVSSALQQLESVSSLSRASIRGHLENLPRGLSDLYHGNLSRIPMDGRTTSKFLLCLIAASKSPLSVPELNWATAVLLTKGNTEDAKEHIQTGFEGTVRKLCGHMVDVSDGKVCFSHRTFRDFVMPVNINSSNAESWYIFTELEANTYIIKCCIWLLQSLKDVTSNMPVAPIGSFSILEKGPEEIARDEQIFGDLYRQNPFLKYTLASLAKQYGDIEPGASEDLMRCMIDLYHDEAAFRLWCRGYWNDCYSSSISNLKEILGMIFSKGMVPFQKLQHLFREKFEHAACSYCMISRNGHVRILHRLLYQDPSLCERAFLDGWTILNTIIEEGQLELVPYVLDKGAEVNHVSLGSAPLHRAVRNGNLDLVQRLIDRNVDMDIQDDDRNSPMHIAARSGNMQIIRLLLASNAKVDILDQKQETPLHKAASRGHYELVVLLKENGSDTDIRNLGGAVPLSNAIHGGRERVVEFLLKHIDKEDLQDSKSAFLHAAVQAANPKIVMLLLDVDIDVNIEDAHGRTAFSYMGERKFERSICEALLDKGADVNARGTDGATLLHKMATVDDVASMQYLLDRDANVDSLTNESDTVLHYAVADGGHEDVFQFLLDNGADIEATNKLGETPLLKAVDCWRSQTTIGLLHKMNAQLEVRNKNGLTPLQIAVQKQNAGLTIDLLRRGADASVKTNDGLDLSQLAEKSFLGNFAAYRRRGKQKFEYQIYALKEDDNMLQQFTGTLEMAAIKKIDWIYLAFKHWAPKLSPNPQSKERPAEPPHD